MERKPFSFIWLIAALLIGFVAAFQISRIQFTYMRDDEEIAFRTTSRDLAYAVWYQAEQDVHAPLWFSSFWLWQQLVGGSEFMGRVYGIFFSMITLALVYQIGKTWFHDWHYGLFALVALGVNVYFSIYSLEIRPYSAVMLLATLSMWAFHRWLIHPTRRRALNYAVILAVMLYTHYFAAFLVAAQVIYLLTAYRRRVKILRQWFGAASLAFLVWLPWFPIFLNQVHKLVSIETTGGNERGIAGIGSTTEPTTLDAIKRLLALMTNGQVIIYGFVLLVGLIYWQRKKDYWLLLLWGLGVPAIALTINLVFAVYTPRYISYLAVGFCLALAGAFAMFRARGVILLSGFAALSLWSYSSQLPINRIPYRLIFGEMAQHTQPGDALYFDRGGYEDALVRWQITHYLPANLAQNRVTDLESALNTRRVWYVTGDLFNAAVKANFAQLEPSHPVQSVFGDCNRNWCYVAQLMEAPPLQTPQVFGADMDFWGEDDVTVAKGIVSAHLWWRLENPPPLDYSMSLRLLDSSGNLIAQADGPVHHYGTETVQTSQMQPGRIYIDYRSITLPPVLPPGMYQVALVVYDWQTGKRLLLPSGSDTLLLDTVPIQQ